MPERTEGPGAEAAEPGAAREPAASDLPPEENPFDVWLRRDLRQAFAAVAGEPVPPELLRLIEDAAPTWPAEPAKP